MARIYTPRKGYSGTPIQTSTGIYGLKGVERVRVPGGGYKFVSEKYPEGVPRTIGRFSVGVPPSAASTARALTSSVPSSRAAAMLISSGMPAITAGNLIRDPKMVEEVLTGGVTSARSYGTAGTGLAAGGSALARGGPSLGTIPGGGLGTVASAGTGGGLSLGGIGSSITSTGSSIMNMVTQYIPLAIKVVLAVIVIKIVLWLIRGKK